MSIKKLETLYTVIRSGASFTVQYCRPNGLQYGPVESFTQFSDPGNAVGEFKAWIGGSVTYLEPLSFARRVEKIHKAQREDRAKLKAWNNASK